MNLGLELMWCWSVWFLWLILDHWKHLQHFLWTSVSVGEGVTAGTGVNVQVCMWWREGGGGGVTQNASWFPWVNKGSEICEKGFRLLRRKVFCLCFFLRWRSWTNAHKDRSKVRSGMNTQQEKGAGCDLDDGHTFVWRWIFRFFFSKQFTLFM